MRYTTVIAALAALALAPAPHTLGAQGQGKGQGGERAAAAQQGRGQERAERERAGRPEAAARGQQGQGRGQGQPRGQGVRTDDREPQGRAARRPATTRGLERAAEVRASNEARASGRDDGRGPPAHARARFIREIRIADMPPAVRRFATSNRPPQFVVAGAVARAHARGLRDDFRIVTVGEQVRIANRRGDVLLLIDEDRARNLGRWEVDVLDTPVRAGSPAFCRSGAGHPVWGRQWCLNKGFGLGDFEDFRWGRTTRVDDIIFRRPRTGERLLSAALLSVLGNTVFDRLALHAITLGFTDPLTGRWGSDPDGGRILLIDSGGRPVAEIVDTDRNDRGDILLVALRPW